MEEYEIGPNGAILYAMDFLLENIEWLLSKINNIINKLKYKASNKSIFNHIFIFDLPGQI
jgi:hypothetical protein